ncbi:helicase-exonuclease AddAB subunit AddB [Gorillibacterium massiliense]|uniref:helicase-exonuclease AddAB subunit AddB n=1 Tax=Gorillibacterium massiliense TaxID=1280390 RepID=UPI0004AFF6BF|nr:helicase-exonuclease AddAB subunit AddB [Gorillibacterium massiliense]
MRQQGQGSVPNRTSALADKMADLSLLYAEYTNELATGQYLDYETYLDKLAEQAQFAPFLEDAEIWVDGFYHFTAQEIAVLAQFAVRCRKVTVTLCLDRPYSAGEKPDEFDLFHSTASAMSALAEKARDLGAVIDPPAFLRADPLPRFRTSPMLAHLEHHFDNRMAPRNRIYRGSEEPQIRLVAAVNRRAETEGCARELLRLVRDEGLRWRDLSVRVRHLEEYADLISAVFPEYGIPFFLDRQRPVLNHPLVEFIRSALELVNRNWPYEAVFRTVKTGFLPLDSRGGSTEGYRVLDLLENYVLARGIQGSRWMDDKTWEYRRAVSLEEDEDEVAILEPHFGEGREQEEHRLIRGCRERILELLLPFQKSLKQGDSVKAMAGALYDLLAGCSVPEQLEELADAAIAAGDPERAREHGQVWDSVVDLLDQLVEIMGDEEIKPDLFAKLVDAGLESICLALVPPAADQVLIGSMDRTRTAQKQVSYILGANEGSLPAKAEEDGILSDAERLALENSGLKLPGNAKRRLLDEQLLMYTVFCSPSRSLIVSYPLADEEGKSLLPAETIRQFKAMFPQVKEAEQLLAAEPAGAEDAEAAAFVGSKTTTLSLLVTLLKRWKEGADISGVWWDVYNRLLMEPAMQNRLGYLLGSLRYRNIEPGIGRESAELLYGSLLRASVSRMERFVACPFSQFASNGLKLRERKVFRLEAPDIGQLFHAALSRVVKELYDETAGWLEMGETEAAERGQAVVETLAPRLQGEILFSSSRYRYIARKLKEIVGRASAVLVRQAKAGGFYPVGLELGFGPGETLPPLRLDLDGSRSMEIVGRIDRVDRADGEKGMYLRVIDYKSSQKSLNLAELFHGLSLQMLTYLDVVLTHSSLWLGSAAEPAGVLYFHVHNPLITATNALDPERAEAEIRRKFRMKGLVLADEEAVRLMDEEMASRTGNSEIIPVGINKDGSFRKGASAASPGQFQTLRGHVRRTIRAIGTDIADGVTAIEPYRQGQETPCRFCSFKPVCQFDPEVPGNHFKTLPARSGSELWTALEESADRGHGDKGGIGSVG